MTLVQGRKPRYKPVLFGGLVLAIVLPIGWSFWRSYDRQVEANRTFLPVEATVLACRVEAETGGRTISSRPYVRFRYEVGGKAYESTQIYFLSPTFVGRGGMEDYLRRFPVGAKVEAYYAPHEPAVAILDRSVHSLALPLALVIGFALAGSGILAYGLWGRPVGAGDVPAQGRR